MSPRRCFGARAWPFCGKILPFRCATGRIVPPPPCRENTSPKVVKSPVKGTKRAMSWMLTKTCSFQRAELGRLRIPSENLSPSDQKSTGRVPSELRVASSCCARVPSEPRVAQAANGRIPSERGKNSGLARNSQDSIGPH